MEKRKRYEEGITALGYTKLKGVWGWFRPNAVQPLAIKLYYPLEGGEESYRGVCGFNKDWIVRFPSEAHLSSSPGVSPHETLPDQKYREREILGYLDKRRHENLHTEHAIIDYPERGLAIPYISGIDLSHSESVDTKLAVKTGYKIGSGLGSMHNRGVLHRDVKPSNIIAGLDGRLVLIDFGLAAFMDWSNKVLPYEEGAIIGTPAYLAPEMWRGKGATVQTDIYSFGITMFSLLAGDVPYRGSDARIAHQAVSRAEPPSLLAYRPDLSRQLTDLVDRAIAKRSTARPPLSELEAVFKEAAKQYGSDSQAA